MNKKRESAQDTYLMYGKHTVEAAIKNPDRIITAIYMTEEQSGKVNLGPLQHKVKPVGKNFFQSNFRAGTVHQEIAAKVRTVYKSNITNLDLRAKEDRIIILDQVATPQNIGNIIRSAAAFGYNNIIMQTSNTPPENSTIAKIAVGTIELVNIYQVTNLANVIKMLKENNYWLAGLDATGHNNFAEIQDIAKLALIIGSEEKGMRKLISEKCDFIVSIPTSDKVESLNAATSASIAMHALKIHAP